MKVRLYVVCLAVAIISVLDYATTAYLLSQPMFFEANPIARHLMQNGTFDVIKLSFSGFAAISSYITYKAEKHVTGKTRILWNLTIVAALICAAFLAIAVVNNLILILGVKQPEFFREFARIVWGVRT